MTSARQLPKLIGEPIKRREDPRLITGLATYVDDIKLPRMLHMSIVRSTHAHARLRRVDVSRARSAPGVALVLTGAEAKAWGEALPTASEVPEMKAATRYPLSADGVVRFVGEGMQDYIILVNHAGRRLELEVEALRYEVFHQERDLGDRIALRIGMQLGAPGAGHG